MPTIAPPPRAASEIDAAPVALPVPVARRLEAARAALLGDARLRRRRGCGHRRAGRRAGRGLRRGVGGAVLAIVHGPGLRRGSAIEASPDLVDVIWSGALGEMRTAAMRTLSR
jgi:hypothetical protein